MPTASPQPTIRRATLEDATRISRHISTLSRQFITPDYSPVGAATLLSHQTTEAIHRAIENDMVYLLAEIRQIPVGTIRFFPSRRHSYHLFVAEAHHWQGIGRRLWDEAKATLGPEPITVNASRFAIGFYERLGFVSTGPPWEKDGVIAYPMRWEKPDPAE